MTMTMTKNKKIMLEILGKLKEMNSSNEEMLIIGIDLIKLMLSSGQWLEEESLEEIDCIYNHLKSELIKFWETENN